MHAIWGLGMLSLTKSVVVVDEHVDVHDYEEVFFYVGANVDPKRDVAAHRGAARPPRPRADAAVLRRQARHRRDREGAGRGRARLAGGDRDERRGQGARRPALGRVRDRARTPARNGGRAGRCGSCHVVDVRRVNGGDLDCGAERGTDSRRTATEPGPAPTIWPIGFAVGIVCILVGLIVSSWIVAAVGARDRRRLRLPLGARGDARAPRRRRARRARAGAGAPRRRRRPAEPTTPRRRGRRGDALPAERLPRGQHTRPRRGDRRRSSRCRSLGFVVLPAFSTRSTTTSTSGRSTTSPRASGSSRTFIRDPTEGEVSRRDGLHPQQRPRSTDAAELHDHLEPLRPPRLPGAAERPVAENQDEAGPSEHGARRSR